MKTAVASVAALLFAACAARSSAPLRAGSPSITGELSLFAASSLTEAFVDLSHQLEAKYAGLLPLNNFAASSTLVHQLQQGGRADVVATADEASMQRLSDAGLVNVPVVFAHNRLAIVVANGNPKQVHALRDLAEPGLVVVLCGSHVPCGTLADRALQQANVRVEAASREEDVKAVLTKVSLGEADAGIVYATDVKAAHGNVEGVTIPAEQNVTSDCAIAAVKAAPNPAAAAAFVALVTSPAGQSTLERYGFGRA